MPLRRLCPVRRTYVLVSRLRTRGGPTTGHGSRASTLCAMPGPSHPRRYSHVLSGNLVLIATLTLFLLMLMKVIRVANLNLPTAYAILSTTGPVNVALGALTLTLPLILIGILSLSFLARGPRSSKVGRAAALLVAGLTVVISTFLTPFYVPLLLMFLVAANYIIMKMAEVIGRRLSEKRSKRSGTVEYGLKQLQAKRNEFQARQEEALALLGQPLSSSPGTEHSAQENPEVSLATAKERLTAAKEHLEDFERHNKEFEELLAEMERRTRELEQVTHLLVTAGALVPILLIMLSSSSLWLPAERFTMTDGSSMVGYTLASDGEWHSVLLEKSRTVRHLKPASIRDRKICSVEEAAASPRSLADYLLRKSAAPRYPSCSLAD